MDGRFVSYFRVSTKRQGASGLGLDGQRAAVAGWLNGGSWTVLAEFIEVESGKDNDRPQLAAALAECRMTGATLVVAKLDRLARNAHFLLGLKESGVEFVAVDMPSATRLTVGIMAMVAEEEGRAISARTIAALAAYKARPGAKPLGGHRGVLPDVAKASEARTKAAAAYAAQVGPVAAKMVAEGLSLHRIAAAMTDRGIRTPRGGAWTATAVRNLLHKMA